MKITLLRYTYRFLSFLTDCTKGFPLFSKWKITMGSLLIGANVISCKQQVAESKQSGAEPKKDTVTDLSTCYVSNPVKGSAVEPEKNTGGELPRKVKVAVDPFVDLDIGVVYCYDPIAPDPEPEAAPDSLKIYDFVTEMPEFVGGTEALLRFIRDNLRCPQPIEGDSHGVVLTEFVVEPDGSISNIRVIRNLSPKYDEEAVRMVRSMPKFKPGKQNGMPVRVYHKILVRFALE